MVKLQKRFAYKYKDKQHYKHILTISSDVIDQLGWKEGVELESNAKGDILVIKPKTRKK
ncbi:MAG TPA: hypothetical protein VJ771_06150 [Candidatus Nitrosotalea sp.]|nr:hypothetical protein [Candidatus Nitrosotalea sp.]